MRSEPAISEAAVRPSLTAAAASASELLLIPMLPSREAPLPPRPWSRKPSKTRASSSTSFT
jgi:hypothetical protein